MSMIIYFIGRQIICFHFYIVQRGNEPIGTISDICWEMRFGSNR